MGSKRYRSQQSIGFDMKRLSLSDRKRNVRYSGRIRSPRGVLSTEITRRWFIQFSRNKMTRVTRQPLRADSGPADGGCMALCVDAFICNQEIKLVLLRFAEHV